MKKSFILAAMACGMLACGDSEPNSNNSSEENTCNATQYAVDNAFQEAIPDAENTDEQCSNGINDFHTKNKDGSESTWFDCANNQCNHSALVQVCEALENTDEKCSDGLDNANATSNGMNKNFAGKTNGLMDCQDPSCFKNPRITVCEAEKPKYEFGADCSDGKDNDGDGLMDCEDPDCLHAKASCCELNGRKRILFDNAHHQVAGSVDWIIDVTGRHPFPSMPDDETQWHGSLSSFALDLLKSGMFVPETLIQNRAFAYGTNEIQDLSQYDVLVIPEPSSAITELESKAIEAFIHNGGGVLFVADHAGADRDGNQVDAFTAINNMLQFMNGQPKEQSPLGFYVNAGSFSQNSTTKAHSSATEHPVLNGMWGKVQSTGMYGAADFTITNAEKVFPLLVEQSAKDTDAPFAIAGTYGQGKFVAIGDSAILGDGTNYLGLKMNVENGYVDKTKDNAKLFLNAVKWLSDRE